MSCTPSACPPSSLRAPPSTRPPSKGLVGSGARSQDTTGPTARLHACACFELVLESPLGDGRGPRQPTPQAKALHVMTCMTHYRWLQLNPRSLICAQKWSLGRRAGGSRWRRRLVARLCFKPSGVVFWSCLSASLSVYLHLSICLLPSCHAAVTLVTPVASDSCGSPARLDLFPRYTVHAQHLPPRRSVRVQYRHRLLRHPSQPDLGTGRSAHAMRDRLILS